MHVLATLAISKAIQFIYIYSFWYISGFVPPLCLNVFFFQLNNGIASNWTIELLLLED